NPRPLDRVPSVGRRCGRVGAAGVLAGPGEAGRLGVAEGWALRPYNARVPLDPLHILGPEGPIARRLGERYEHRPEQDAMVRAVRETLDLAGSPREDADRSHVLVVEAGTGVGKSFAYLLPAIEQVLRHRDDGDKR